MVIHTSHNLEYVMLHFCSSLRQHPETESGCRFRQLSEEHFQMNIKCDFSLELGFPKLCEVFGPSLCLCCFRNIDSSPLHCLFSLM